MCIRNTYVSDVLSCLFHTNPHCCAAPAKRTLLAGSSTQTRCVKYFVSRDIIGEEAGTTSFKYMVRYARTGPALSTVAKKKYQAVGLPCNRMLKLSSSRGIRIDVPVLSVSWSFEDHSVIIQAVKEGLIEHEASDTGGVPRWKSSCPDRLAEATISRYFSELGWRSLAEELGRCCRIQQIRPLLGVRRT